jgi:hypothetical protein
MENSDNTVTVDSAQRRIQMTEQKKQEKLHYLKDVVMRQTDYSEEQTLAKLNEYNNDIMAIVREFMGVINKVKENKTTVNQQVYSEIRGLMDNAAASYKLKKENEGKKQLYIKKMCNELVRRQQLAADASNNITPTTETKNDVTS